MPHCPGYAAGVLSEDSIGLGLGTADTPDGAKTKAQQEAIGKAISGAMSQVGNHQCGAPCITIPIPRLLASGGDVIAAVSNINGKPPGPFSAFGWAKAQL